MAALTITSQRELYLDFTEPFLNLGISILFRRELKNPDEKYSFLSSFSSGLWICIIIAYLGMV